MRPKERTNTPQSDLFRLKLVNPIDLRHELCPLGEKINWPGSVEQFGALYAEHGRPGVPIRLMAGLHYLKHAFGLSDEVWSRVGSRTRIGNIFAAKNISSIACR
jgi:transposase, IS5 family